MALDEKKCLPCQIGDDPLTETQIKEYLPMVPKWQVKKNRLTRLFKFKDFMKAIGFLNKVADIAEEEGHHPDFRLFNYNKVEFILFTHKINGLHLNDFILAAKINNLLS